MGIFFNGLRSLNELTRTGPNGQQENISQDDDEDEDVGAPPTDDEDTNDNDQNNTPDDAGDDDSDLGDDMPTDDDEEGGDEGGEEPPAEDEGEDDGDLGDDMPSDDDEGGDDNTVGDDTDYNIPDDDNADGEDEGDLGDDMPTDDDEGGDDSGEPPAEGDDTGGGDEDEDLGGDMPSDGDEEGGEGDAGEDAEGGTSGGGSGDGGSTGDDDTSGTDDDSESDSTGGAKTAEEIDNIEKELFSDLSDQQMAIKHIELKSQFIDLYETLGDVIERVNKIPKTDSNIKALEFVGTKLTELRTMIHYNLTEGYPTRGYTENMVIYQQCLATLNTINQLLEELAPKTSNSDEET